MDNYDSAGAENTLLLVADVLATLAVTETGQRQLLYGETQDRWQRSRYYSVSAIRCKDCKDCLEMENCLNLISISRSSRVIVWLREVLKRSVRRGN